MELKNRLVKSPSHVHGELCGCQRVFHDGHYDFLFEGELHHAVTPRGKSDGKAVQFVSHGPFAAVVSLAQACLGVNCVRPCCKPVSPTGGERRALLSDAHEPSCSHVDEDSLKTTKLYCGGICCPMEVPVIENCLKKLPGVRSVEVAVVTKAVTVRHVEHETSAAAMLSALNEARMEASLTFPRKQVLGARSWSPPWHVWLSAVLLVISFFYYLSGPLNAPWLEYFKYIALAAVAVPLPGIILKALGALRHGILDIHFLMTLAVAGAIAIGEYTEAGTVVVLFSVADFLESRCTGQARDAISSVLSLRPETAILADSGEEVEASAVPIGSSVLVRAGEKSPLDGVVVTGISAFDESMLTGESVPVLKSAGDHVKAGTMNAGNSMVVIKTETSAEDTFVAGMAKLVEEATSRQSPSEAAVAKFARIYTPIVILTCVLIAFVPWANPNADREKWVYLALEVLVIACPCALVLSTPVTVVSALARAAQSGVLIKGGLILENLASIRVVSFDKTGTLTKGTFMIAESGIRMSPEVTTTNFESGTPPASWDVSIMLKLLGSLERGSSHPFAAAISGKAAAMGIKCDLPVNSMQSIPGSGMVGEVGGRTVKAGTAAFIAVDLEPGQQEALEEASTSYKKMGLTTCFVSIDDTFVCSISAKDVIREDAHESIMALKDLGITPVMLTGDNRSVAMAIGREAGIDDCHVHAELMPQDKLSLVSTYRDDVVIDTLSCCRPRDSLSFAASTLKVAKDIVLCSSCRNRGGEIRGHMHGVAHVGDGVNDAPALAAATVGIAMGVAGAAAALEAGDVALFTNDLRMIAALQRLSIASRRTITFNISFSVATKAIVLALAFANLFTLWAAVLVDVGTALFVTLMGLRMLRYDFKLGLNGPRVCIGEQSAATSSCCAKGCCSGGSMELAELAKPGCCDDHHDHCGGHEHHSHEHHSHEHHSHEHHSHEHHSHEHHSHEHHSHEHHSHEHHSHDHCGGHSHHGHSHGQHPKQTNNDVLL